MKYYEGSWHGRIFCAEAASRWGICLEDYITGYNQPLFAVSRYIRNGARGKEVQLLWKACIVPCSKRELFYFAESWFWCTLISWRNRDCCIDIKLLQHCLFILFMYLLLLGRITAVAIHVVYCYRRSSMVCLSVCWSRLWALQIRLNWLGCQLEVDSGGPNEPCILDGVQILLRGCPVHWKALGAFAMVYTKTAEMIEMGADWWTHGSMH